MCGGANDNGGEEQCEKNFALPMEILIMTSIMRVEMRERSSTTRDRSLCYHWSTNSTNIESAHTGAVRNSAPRLPSQWISNLEEWSRILCFLSTKPTKICGPVYYVVSALIGNNTPRNLRVLYLSAVELFSAKPNDPGTRRRCGCREPILWV